MQPEPAKKDRKRKRKDQFEDLEDKYLSKLAEDDDVPGEKRRKGETDGSDEKAAAKKSEAGADDGIERWCTCHKPDTGELMIGCDNDDCPIQWYHGRCIGLDTAPEGDWLCATCSPADEGTSARGAKGKGKAKGKGSKTTKKKVAAKAPAKGKGAKGKKK